MARYVFCIQVAQMKFVGPGPQSQVFFIYFMILLDFFYDSWEKKVLFVKIQARVLDLWLDTPFGSRWPKQPNVVSRPQAPRSRIFSRFHDFLGFISWLSWLICLVIMYPAVKNRPHQTYLKKLVFLWKYICVLWASIAQVISLFKVDPDRSWQNCRIFFYAKLFVDSAPTLQR